MFLVGQSGTGPAEAVTSSRAWSYASESDQRDRAVAAARARIEARPDDRVAVEAAAAAHVARARLTGRYDDYVQAEALLARAFRLAPKGGGPLLARARLHYSLHKLDEAEAALQALARWAVVPNAAAAAAADLRVALALQRGAGEDAARMAAANLAKGPSMGRLVSTALVDAAFGRTKQADAGFVKALASLGKKRVPYHRAWLHLQRGIIDLDRGRYEEALEHYLAGDGALSGWWLIREHMAEIHVLLGNATQAAELYREVTRTDDHPELLHAFAEFESSRGRSRQAKALMKRAGTGHERRLKLISSAAGGHALDYFLAVAEQAKERGDPEAPALLRRAVALARADRDRRPGAPSSIALAAALLASGDIPSARQAIGAARATKLRSTDLFVTAHEIYRAAGDSERAAAMRASALAHNPRAFE